MKKKLSIFCSIFLCLFFSNLNAQSGTDFWFAPPDVTDLHNPPGGEPIYLLISSFNQPATVTISQPANPGFTPITVNLAANSSTRINLTPFKSQLETRPTNTVLNTGLRIQSTAKIQCYYEVSNTNNTDIFALKGPNGLGKEFYIPLHKHAPFYNHTFSSPHLAIASFDIVATQNNTQVTIYSPVPVDGYPALQQFTITLNAGQTYSCGWTGANYTQPSTHPGGAVVISDKPIAITIKDDSNHNPSGGCYDLMGDQIVPVDILGTEYIAVKGQLNNNGDESVIITAVQNNTKVYIDGNPVPVATLFAGEVYRYDMDYLSGGPNNSVYIQTSKPVYCMHVTGFGCEMGEAILPPLNCAGSSQVSFVRSTSEAFYLTILVRSSAVNNFSIIGPGTATINPASFQNVPGTGGLWKAAKIQYNTTEIPVDSTFLVTNSADVFALGIINGGATTGCRYGYFSEFAAKNVVDAGNDQFVCANSVVTLNGSVQGGDTSGIWTTNGSGYFTPSNTSLNATYVPSAADTTNGSIYIWLTSTGNCTPVKDSIKITFTPAPYVEAGSNILSCGTDTVQLNGMVGGPTLTGIWTTAGTGSFIPNAAALNAKYVPSTQDVSNGQVWLYLTSTGNGNCNPAKDSVLIQFTQPAVVNAPSDTTICATYNSIAIIGTVSGGTNTGIWSSSGSGFFSPSPTSLNATYYFSSGDTANGSVWLYLTSTNNGPCPAKKDSMLITFMPKPVVEAGPDMTVCANNAQVNLSGSIYNSTSAVWSTSGSGTFSPNNQTLNATYITSNQDKSNGQVWLYLTTTTPVQCLPVKDSVKITITPAPQVNAGPDQFVCVTNLNVQLNGSVTGGSFGGVWTTLGTGTFSPSNISLNATYSASSQDSANGSVTLILTSTNNGNCLPVSDTMKIFILPAGTANAGPDLTICANSVAQLNGQVGGAATTGYWTSQGSGGFTPSANALNATYVPSPADTANGYVVLILHANSCNQAKDTLVLTITDAPVANAGPDDDVCANNPSINLSGSVFIATGGVWSGGTGTYNPSNTQLNTTYMPSAQEVAQGYVQLILTTSGNGSCNPSYDTVVYTITPAPQVNAGPDQYVCKAAGQTQLNGVVSGGTNTGVWSTTGTGTFSPNPNILNSFYVFSPSDTAQGFVYLILTSTNNGKCAAVSDTLLLTFGNSSFVDAGPDLYVCENNLQASLNGFVSGGSSTGQWSTMGDGQFNPSNQNLNTVYILGTNDSINGQVTIYLTSTNNDPGCLPGMDSLIVFVQKQHIANAGNDITACPSTKPIGLIGQVQNSTGGIWSTSGTGFFVPNDSSLITSYVPSPQDSALGQFYIVLTTKYNGACPSVSDTIWVNMVNMLNADFAYSNACVDQNVNFIDSSSIPTGNINSWYWTFGDGYYGFLQNEMHVYTQTGTYNVTLVVKSDNGCIDTVIKTVNIYPSPSAGFTVNGNVFAGMPISFTNTSTGQTYNWWNFGDGTGTSSVTNPVYTYDSAGNYIVSLTVTNNFGCSDSISQQLVVNPIETKVYPPVLPNTFTPNGDGNNDILFVRGGPFKTLTFTVYDEWGNQIFISNDESIGWDGTYNGKEVPVGVYVYTVNAETMDGKIYNYTAEVKLVR